MSTTVQTTDTLAISKIIYYTDNGANGVDANPPFIPVNAPGVPGAGISYGGVPTGAQTVTAGGSGYTNGTVYPTKLIGRPAEADGSQAANNISTPLIGQGLTITATANAAGVITAAAIANAGTGYITGMQVEVLGNVAGAEPAILTIVGAAANNQALIDANKEAQLEQCENLYPFNATTGIAYSEVANGSNVVGVGELIVENVTAASANGDFPEDTALVVRAVVTDSPAGGGTGAITYTWSATGAGLTANAGTAVGGQPTQRSFTPTDPGNLVITCTVEYATTGSGATASNNFTIV